MTSADIEKIRNTFKEKYGISLGRSGALFLAILLKNAKSSDDLLKKAILQIKKSIVSKPIHFNNFNEAFGLGLGLTALPSFVCLIFGSILLYLSYNSNILLPFKELSENSLIENKDFGKAIQLKVSSIEHSKIGKTIIYDNKCKCYWLILSK